MNRNSGNELSSSIKRMELILFVTIGLFIIILLGLVFFFDSQLKQAKLDEALEASDAMTSVEVSDQAIEKKIMKPVQGQVVYVPAYSNIYLTAKTRHELTITLSVRNTDEKNGFVLNSVRYYNTEGKLVKSLLKNAIEVKPLATKEFVIEKSDKSGGSGANFIVEWVSETPVKEPIIEALMLDTWSNQGISFICEGKVIEEIEPKKEEAKETSDQES